MLKCVSCKYDIALGQTFTIYHLNTHVLLQTPILLEQHGEIHVSDSSERGTGNEEHVSYSSSDRLWISQIFRLCSFIRDSKLVEDAVTRSLQAASSWMGIQDNVSCAPAFA